MTSIEAAAAIQSGLHTPRRAASRAEASRQAEWPGLVTPEERERMIAEAAFFCSERRGFAPGAELDDWLSAEREIERRLAGGASEQAPS